MLSVVPIDFLSSFYFVQYSFLVHEDWLKKLSLTIKIDYRKNPILQANKILHRQENDDSR